jgi:hypothetical protein
MTLDPRAFETSGIPQKVLRSLKPELATSDLDAQARSASQKRLLRSIHQGPISEENVFPTAGMQQARRSSDPIALHIPATHFQKVAEKMVRGISYVADETFIEPPLKVDFIPIRSDINSEFVEIIKQQGVAMECGPGITIRRVLVVDMPPCGLYEIELWGGQLCLYASVDVG